MYENPYKILKSDVDYRELVFDPGQIILDSHSNWKFAESSELMTCFNNRIATEQLILNIENAGKKLDIVTKNIKEEQMYEKAKSMIFQGGPVAIPFTKEYSGSHNDSASLGINIYFLFILIFMVVTSLLHRIKPDKKSNSLRKLTINNKNLLISVPL